MAAAARAAVVALLALALALTASAGPTLSLPSQPTGTTTTGFGPIPGPRDCFWLRGPCSGDPYINIAYPDQNTFYWSTVFTTPPGAKLRLEGKFPRSRYISFQGYNEKGEPSESVADYLIKPSPGSKNPFLPGADRNVSPRNYVIKVVDGPPDPRSKTGANRVGQTQDQLSAPSYGPTKQQSVLYRIYARDKGTDETAGGGLPVPVLTLANGKEVRGAELCKIMNTSQTPALDPAAMAVPFPKYAELVEAAGNISRTHPATMPPTWSIQMDRAALYGIYTNPPGTPPKANAPRSAGGFYPNLDNQYIRTILNRRLGPVFVVRGKAPTTPKTFNGNPRFGNGTDMRYWSFCSCMGFANTRVNDCAYDEQYPLDKDGYYTLVVSRKADRPRNAVKECGVVWLPMDDEGDGALDKDVTVLQLRHMLAAPGFKNSIYAITKPGEEAKSMGAYYPQGFYTTPSSFETLLPCLPSK